MLIPRLTATIPLAGLSAQHLFFRACRPDGDLRILVLERDHPTFVRVTIPCDIMMHPLATELNPSASGIFLF
jgi:hypothetical protein